MFNLYIRILFEALRVGDGDVVRVVVVVVVVVVVFFFLQYQGFHQHGSLAQGAGVATIIVGICCRCE